MAAQTAMQAQPMRWWQRRGWRVLLLIGAVVAALVSSGLAAEGAMHATELPTPPAGAGPFSSTEPPEDLPDAMVSSLSGGINRPLEGPLGDAETTPQVQQVSDGDRGTLTGPSKRYHVRVGSGGGSDRGVVLDRGHVDAFEVTYDSDSGGLGLLIKDDTRLHDSGIVYRDPEGVTIAYADDQAMSALPSGDQWSFLGGFQGEDAWVAQQSGGDQGYVPWVGWSTERLHSSLEDTSIEPVSGNAVELSITVSGPGEVFTFMNDFGGSPVNRYIDTTAASSHTIPITANAHVHTNWVFTAEGDYTFTVTPTLTATGVPADSAGGGDGDGDGPDNGDGDGADNGDGGDGAGNGDGGDGAGNGGGDGDLAETGAINVGSLSTGALSLALFGFALAAQPRRRRRNRRATAGAAA